PCSGYCSFYCHFFNPPSLTAIYPLSLHDALPISNGLRGRGGRHGRAPGCAPTPYGGTKVGAPVRWAPGGGTLQHARGRGTAGAVYGLQGGAAAGGEPYRP